jgi:HSP20 family protein
MADNSLTTQSDRHRDPFNWLRQEVDQLFQNIGPISSNLADSFPLQRLFSALPTLDVAENEKEFTVTADVPGLEEKDLKVEFSNKVLTIKGEKNLNREEKQKNYYLAERWDGSFSRSIQLPLPINENLIQAQVKDGVLHIILPKAEGVEKQIKSIEVKKA